MRQALIVVDIFITVMWYLLCLLFCAILDSSYEVSTKMDFGNDEEVTVTNSSKVEDEDVEVKHTIVVSTKLKNNNRRGLHAPSDGDGSLTYSIGTPKDTHDSGEVPVLPGYKSVESTRLRTPDTRLKSRIYPDSVFVSRNIRDELDIVPNLATNPMQWKPSNFFNNINWWTPDVRPQSNFVRRNERPLIDNNRLQKKISNDGMKELYCRRCRELSVGVLGQPSIGCVQRRSNNPWMYETTTPKMKLDGKLAKLN